MPMESEDFINNQHILCRQLKMNKDLFDCETLVSFGAVPANYRKKSPSHQKKLPPLPSWTACFGLLIQWFTFCTPKNLSNSAKDQFCQDFVLLSLLLLKRIMEEGEVVNLLMVGPPTWKIWVKWNHFPKDRGESKNDWNHQLVKLYHSFIYV